MNFLAVAGLGAPGRGVYNNDQPMAAMRLVFFLSRCETKAKQKGKRDYEYDVCV